MSMTESCKDGSCEREHEDHMRGNESLRDGMDGKFDDGSRSQENDDIPTDKGNSK